MDAGLRHSVEWRPNRGLTGPLLFGMNVRLFTLFMAMQRTAARETHSQGVVCNEVATIEYGQNVFYDEEAVIEFKNIRGSTLVRSPPRRVPAQRFDSVIGSGVFADSVDTPGALARSVGHDVTGYIMQEQLARTHHHVLTVPRKDTLMCLFVCSLLRRMLKRTAPLIHLQVWEFAFGPLLGLGYRELGPLREPNPSTQDLLRINEAGHGKLLGLRKNRREIREMPAYRRKTCVDSLTYFDEFSHSASWRNKKPGLFTFLWRCGDFDYQQTGSVPALREASDILVDWYTRGPPVFAAFDTIAYDSI